MNTNEKKIDFLFRIGFELSGKLSDLFADGNGSTLQRLLSEANVNDNNLDFSDLFKLDSNKQLDSRTLSEFVSGEIPKDKFRHYIGNILFLFQLRSESFDQLMAYTANENDAVANPSAQPCSTSSFSELRSVSPEFSNDHMFQMASSTTHSNQGALNAIEHDHAFLTKRTPVSDVPSSSTTSKRNPTRGSRRTSSRLQSRAVCTTAPDERPTNKNKRPCQTTRAADVRDVDDLSYYLERRRKNNEASKVSRAVRKQKFGDMDQQW